MFKDKKGNEGNINEEIVEPEDLMFPVGGHHIV